MVISSYYNLQLTIQGIPKILQTHHVTVARLQSGAALPLTKRIFTIIQSHHFQKPWHKPRILGWYQPFDEEIFSNNFAPACRVNCSHTNFTSEALTCSILVVEKKYLHENWSPELGLCAWRTWVPAFCVFKTSFMTRSIFAISQLFQNLRLRKNYN